jgi:hypothetical protein
MPFCTLTASTFTCRRDDNDDLFVPDQNVLLDLYSASSLEQQSAGRQVAPLGHIIQIPSQPVVVLSPKCCVLREEATNTNFIVWFDLIGTRTHDLPHSR